MRIKRLYEDKWLLILDKPSRLLSIPAPKKEKDLTSIINEELKKKDITYRLHPCHRLDYSTSGLIIYAKGKSIQKKMMRLFKEGKVKKTYLAFVQGKLTLPDAKIDFPLEGKQAITKYSLIEQRKNFAIVEVFPLTGRRNQIRLHFKMIGHPIIGEDKFCFRKDFKIRFRRLCLHAKSLEFLHPITDKKIYVESELPSDLKRFLEKNL
ncbi:MAG: RNA pseudouridine synthase [Candidatus Omnitrophica bacterium]|nr:RNA pseudouridine synthase [Candidatus Omnitrophota bacterium]MCM8800054.1 RNA pseudouridine synthase [Candidatus Omnitrophota bacterium]